MMLINIEVHLAQLGNGKVIDICVGAIEYSGVPGGCASKMKLTELNDKLRDVVQEHFRQEMQEGKR